MNDETLADRLIAGAVWAVSTADEHADILSPRRIKELYGAADAMREAAEALANRRPQAAAVAEPVRFLYVDANGNEEITKQRKSGGCITAHGLTETPLYAHPSDRVEGLVRAAYMEGREHGADAEVAYQRGELASGCTWEESRARAALAAYRGEG